MRQEEAKSLKMRATAKQAQNRTQKKVMTPMMNIKVFLSCKETFCAVYKKKGTTRRMYTALQSIQCGYILQSQFAD